jgi:hypothetical protein
MNDASQSIQGVSTSAGSAQQGVNRSSNSMASALGKVKVAAAAAAAAAVAAGVAYAANLVRTGLQAADEQAKLARQLGMTATELATLERAADLSGVSASNLTRSVEGLNRRLGEALEGAGPTADALERLGLSAEELVELSPQEQFEALGEAIEQLGSHAERSAAAQDLFGRSGQRMLLLLDGAEDTFARASGEVEAFGLALDSFDSARIEAINDNMSTLGTIMEGVALQIASAFAPALESITNAAVAAAHAIFGQTNATRELVEQQRRLEAMTSESTNTNTDAELQIQRMQTAIAGWQEELVQAERDLHDASSAMESWEHRAETHGTTVQGLAEMDQYWRAGIMQSREALVLAQAEVDKLNNDIAGTERTLESAANATRQYGQAMEEAGESAGGASTEVEGWRQAMDQWVTTRATVEELMRRGFVDEEDGLRRIIAATEQYAEALVEAGQMGSVAQNDLLDQLSRLQSRLEELGVAAEENNPLKKIAPQEDDTIDEGLQRRIDAIADSFLTTEQMVEQHYSQRLETINAALEQEIIDETEHAALREQIEEDAQDRLTQIQQDAMNNRIRFAANAYGMMANNIIGAVEGIATATADSEKKQFKIRKNAAIASALVSTAQGVARTIADYPFPLSAAMAASQIALGAGQIAAIKSQTFNGGGSPTEPTAPAPDTTTAEASAPDMQRSITIQGVEPGMLYSGEAVRALMDNIAEQQRDGYQVLLT